MKKKRLGAGWRSPPTLAQRLRREQPTNGNNKRKTNPRTSANRIPHCRQDQIQTSQDPSSGTQRLLKPPTAVQLSHPLFLHVHSHKAM